MKVTCPVCKRRNESDICPTCGFNYELIKTKEKRKEFLEFHFRNLFLFEKKEQIQILSVCGDLLKKMSIEERDDLDQKGLKDFLVAYQNLLNKNLVL